MGIKEGKKEQIVMAAAEEFLQKGIDGASMHNIANLAEVSKRTLYKYYPSKEQLYFALIDEILNRVEGMYDLPYTDETEVSEQIAQVVREKMNLILTDSFLKISKIIIGELFKGRSPTQEQLMRFSESEEQFASWIEQAQKDGKITTEMSSHDIATQFHSILKGQIYWPVLMGFESKETIDIEKVHKMTVDFFVKSFCI